MKAAGHFFRKLSSKEEEGEIIINNHTASIWSAGDIVCRDVKILSIQGKRNVYLDNGFLFVLSEPLSLENKLAYQNNYQKSISWLEIFSLKKAIILSVILLVGLFVLRFLLSASVGTLVAVFPYKWEEQIGKNAYTSLSTFAFDESNLSNERTLKIRTQANAIIEANDLRRTEIYFH